MRTFLACLVLFATLTACEAVKIKSPGASVRIYKYFGSVQCTIGGMTLSAMESQLTNAGIPILTSACGTDGNIYTAVCGAADGRIGIFEIPATQESAASAIGFVPLSNLPAANKVACH